MMYRIAIGLLVALVLSACSSSRYSMRHDAAPQGDFDAGSVPDARPVWEPLSPQGNRSPYVVRGKRYEVMPNAAGYREEGIASWYGLKFHGELTSNGEVYNMYAMSAAHKSLPLPTYVKVTNLANQRSVIVRVNDRGPFHDDRVIDLSYAAAKKLGFQKQGTARVSLEAIVPARDGSEQVADDGLLNSLAPFVQVGAFGKEASAKALKARVEGAVAGHPVFIGRAKHHAGDIFRVRVGPFDSQQDAEQIRQQLARAGIGKPLIITRSLQAKHQ